MEMPRSARSFRAAVQERSVLSSFLEFALNYETAVR